MTIDDAGVQLIVQHEGVRLKAYKDSVGKWTIGYGHTATARPGMTITKEQAVQLLRKDVARFEACVEEAITVPLSQAQFNALVSFAFNLGCNGFKKSSVVSYINEEQFDSAMATLLKYNKAGSKVLAGLTKRRKAESAMFAGGAATSPGNYAGVLQWILGGSFRQAVART